MKNLIDLLKLKAEKHKHIVVSDNGTISPLSTGAKGVVSNLDDSILKTLFNEYPLSDANVEAFNQLKKIKIPSAKVKKEKEKK